MRSPTEPEMRVCLGYAKRELLPPYDESYPTEAIIRIKNIVDNDLKIVKLGTTQDFVRWLDNGGSSLRYLEIIGAWVDGCIPFSVNEAINRGKDCRVDLDLVVLREESDDDTRQRIIEDRIRTLRTQNGYTVSRSSNYLNFCPIR